MLAVKYLCPLLLMAVTAVEAINMFGYDLNIFSTPQIGVETNEAAFQGLARNSDQGSGPISEPSRRPRGRRVVQRTRQLQGSSAVRFPTPGCSDQFGFDQPCECNGPRGMKGAPGVRGDRGEDGQVGPQGRPGKIGEDGLTGEPGDQGHRGDKGDRGDTFDGETGKPGVPGAPGDYGDNGEPGLPGPVGPPGDVGVRGARGDRGLDGERGVPGKAGKDGYPGSVGEPGPEGKRGHPGSAGLKGDTGDSGKDGKNGEKGSVGIPGGQGNKGEKGERGDRGDSVKGTKGTKGLNGLKGIKGISGEEAYKGTKGVRGPRGDNGAPGISIRGENGSRGNPGLEGDKGFKGEKGDKGLQGPPAKGGIGMKGLKGIHGDRGMDGDDGALGLKGDVGDDGEKGDDGERGVKGTDKNFIGQKGYKGDKGVKGADGEKGYMGDPGDDGANGPRGPPGEKGVVGKKGEQGDADCIRPPGPPGDLPFIQGGQIYARHTQVASVKYRNCPEGHVFLWSGYSLLHTEDGGRANVQDLGAAGSCMRTFMPTPFIRAFEIENTFASVKYQPSQSYWLSAHNSSEPKPSQMLTKDAEIKNQISRCSVCMARGPVLALHSQTSTIPKCPNDKWKPLWSGYSFVMHTVGRAAGGQRLESPGSCLPFYRPHPFIECNADQSCAFFSDKMSYWLMANPSKSAAIMSAAEMTSHVSRCVVCADDELIPISDDRLQQDSSFENVNTRK